VTARSSWLLGAILLVAAVASSGCFGDTGTAAEDTAPGKRQGTTNRVAPPPVDQAEAERNLTRAQTKWHVHDLWGNQDILTLLEGDVVLPLNADAVGPNGFRSGRVEFTFPHGTLVPPEAGHLEVLVLFEAATGLPFTGLNLSYRDAGSENFTNLGPLDPASPVRIPVDFFSADVPHAGATAWGFVLEATPDARGMALANGTARVTITAHRAREVFLDPPHGSAFRGASIVPLLPDLPLLLSGAKLAEGKYLVERDGAAQVQPALASLAPRNGSIVPEGAKSVLVRVAWTGSAVAPFAVTYEEPNSPSAGTLTVLEEGADYRLFGLEVTPEMVDSPYAFRSVWRFHLHLEGPAGPVPKLPVTVTAWAAAVPPGDAAALIGNM